MKGEFAQLFAFHQIEKQSGEMFAVLYKIINLVIGVLVIVITTMMAAAAGAVQGVRKVMHQCADCRRIATDAQRRNHAVDRGASHRPYAMAEGFTASLRAELALANYMETGA